MCKHTPQHAKNQGSGLDKLLPAKEQAGLDPGLLLLNDTDLADLLLALVNRLRHDGNLVLVAITLIGQANSLTRLTGDLGGQFTPIVDRSIPDLGNPVTGNQPRLGSHRTAIDLTEPVAVGRHPTEGEAKDDEHNQR